MKLKELDKQQKDELSMIEVAHAILEDNNNPMAFADLTNKVQQYLGDDNKDIRDRLPQFYTDLNVDGSFISLGNNKWGLRTWYPFESVNEATVSESDGNDAHSEAPHKVKAFLAEDANDDDVIDYDNDDPEDQDEFDEADDDQFHKDADASDNTDEENPDDSDN